MEKLDCKKLTVSQKTANFIDLLAMSDKMWDDFDAALQELDYGDRQIYEIMTKEGFETAMRNLDDIIKHYMFISIKRALVHSDKMEL